MKRIYFFNDWMGNLPWYYKVPIFLPVIISYSLPYDLTGNELLDRSIQVLLIAIYLFFIGFSIFRWLCKNAFIYQNHNHFQIRLNGDSMDIDAKFISEISFDKNQQLQTRRINRVDRYDLSAFRVRDRDKLLGLLKEYTSADTQISDQPITTV